MSNNPIFSSVTPCYFGQDDDPQTIFYRFISKKLAKRHPNTRLIMTPQGIISQEASLWVIPEWKYIVDPIMSTWSDRHRIQKLLHSHPYEEVHFIYPRSGFFTKRFHLKYLDTKIKLIPISINPIRKQISEKHLF